MLKKILLGLVAMLVLLLVLAAFQPTDYTVTRTATLAAPPAAVFAEVDDFHAWEAWSPWAKLDPAMKETYEGPSSGAGAKYSWAGNDDVGEGRMTILESRANELIRIRLEFLKPFEADNSTEFTFAPAAGGTLVTWSMSGHNSFVCKVFCVFMDMDKMVGADFEKGLAALGDVVTKANPPR